LPNAPLPPWEPRRFAPGQRSELRTVDIDTGETRLVYATDEIIEAPNWTPDGRWLIYNGGGDMFRVAADGSAPPEPIPLGGLKVNDDHALSLDGRQLFLSSYDGHLHVAPIEGGEPRRFSKDTGDFFLHFLHGVSPDGSEAVCVGMWKDGEAIRLNLYAAPTAGGSLRQLTDLEAHDDGPEFSADGATIYFNSQRNDDTPQQSQIFRMGRDGSGVEQLVRDGRNNWFPHPSPDGRLIAYLSYGPETIGRPTEAEVEVRIAGADGGDPRCLVRLFGGRGTINVNSWAPDSRRLAYVAYPLRAS
jgi:Tol biopolymer transport system component